jgi:hypothetical protein
MCPGLGRLLFHSTAQRRRPRLWLRHLVMERNSSRRDWEQIEKEHHLVQVMAQQVIDQRVERAMAGHHYRSRPSARQARVGRKITVASPRPLFARSISPAHPRRRIGACTYDRELCRYWHLRKYATAIDSKRRVSKGTWLLHLAAGVTSALCYCAICPSVNSVRVFPM